MASHTVNICDNCGKEHKTDLIRPPDDWGYANYMTVAQHWGSANDRTGETYLLCNECFLKAKLP